MKNTLRLLALLGIFAAGYFAGSRGPSRANAAPAPDADRVFEIRTYTSPPGKIDVLHRRFREHSMEILTRHGMRHIGYWVPTDTPRAGNTLIYIVAHRSRDAAQKSWADFRADPEWKKVAAASEQGGKIVSKVESVFVRATDYSPIQ